MLKAGLGIRNKTLHHMRWILEVTLTRISRMKFSNHEVISSTFIQKSKSWYTTNMCGSQSGRWERSVGLSFELWHIGMGSLGLNFRAKLLQTCREIDFQAQPVFRLIEIHDHFRHHAALEQVIWTLPASPSRYAPVFGFTVDVGQLSQISKDSFSLLK